eukprot:11114962-Karenia_brevis.AAC.1
MEVGDACTDFLLCAQVSSDEWLCYGTTAIKDETDVENLFDEENLIRQSINGATFHPPPGKTRQRSLQSNQLRACALKCSAAWNRLIAMATWKAEEIRAKSKPFDQTVATARYEANPWRWNTKNTK